MPLALELKLKKEKMKDENFRNFSTVCTEYQADVFRFSPCYGNVGQVPYILPTAPTVQRVLSTCNAPRAPCPIPIHHITTPQRRKSRITFSVNIMQKNTRCWSAATALLFLLVSKVESEIIIVESGGKIQVRWRILLTRWILCLFV